MYINNEYKQASDCQVFQVVSAFQHKPDEPLVDSTRFACETAPTAFFFFNVGLYEVTGRLLSTIQAVPPLSEA